MHSDSIASDTKSHTHVILNQNSSSRTKLDFDFWLSETTKPVGGQPKCQKKTNKQKKKQTNKQKKKKGTDNFYYLF
jgi:hypothetical protein